MIFSAWFYCSLTFSDGILVSAHDDDDGDVVVAVHGQVRPDVLAAALLRELAAAKNGSAHRAAEGASAIFAGIGFVCKLLRWHSRKQRRQVHNLQLHFRVT